MTIKILIVDSDKTYRDFLKRQLCRLNLPCSYCIDEVSSGAGAIASMRHNEYDCVLLDYQLPDINGISFLRSIGKNAAGLPLLPIVMLASAESESVMADALRYGAQDYLVKETVTPDILQITIERAQMHHSLLLNKSPLQGHVAQTAEMQRLRRLLNDAFEFNQFLVGVLEKSKKLIDQIEDLRAAESVLPANVEPFEMDQILVSSTETISFPNVHMLHSLISKTTSELPEISIETAKPR